MAGPITKSELNALEAIVREPNKASFKIDDPFVSSLEKRGMVRTKLGKTQATARGRMTVQRNASLGRGRKGGRSGGMID